jgi:hypothetical protein
LNDANRRSSGFSVFFVQLGGFMLRRPIAVLLVAAVLCLTAGAATPDGALDLGLRAFRAGDNASAVVDLDTAAQPGAPPQVRATALVYLALAQFRLGREDDARATILRLLDAERLDPVYATLPLHADALEFETLAAALVPESNLPKNVPNGTGDLSQPLPPVTRVEEPAPPQTDVASQVEIQARAEIEDAERRAAASEARAQRELEARMEAERATAEARTAVRMTEGPDAAVVRAALNDLRQAEALGDQGEIDAARRIYARLTGSPAREVVAAAAVGLYRTAAYREAIDAFRSLGALARGEEDLHYYYAVALYEVGELAAARRELACALPFIEVTDEVARYRLKIENSQS